jgi:serine phosphatase RsbU (regulator of sigma subunit)
MAALSDSSAGPAESPGGAPAVYPRAVVLVVVAVCYSAGSAMAYGLIHLSSAGAVFFPAAGVSLAALVLSPRRHWPAIALTIASTELLIDLAQGHSWQAAMGFAVANTLEPLVAAALLMPGGRVGLDLRRRRDLGRFVGFAVIVGPLLGGVVGGSTISMTWGTGWVESVLSFWAGDAIGVLTVGAAILTGKQLRQSPLKGAWAFLVTGCITALAFLPTIPMAYLSILPLVWLAMNVSIAALCAGGLGMTLAANLATSLGSGPWGSSQGTTNLEIATLQLFLAVAILAAWLLAVENRERERAFRRFRVAQDDSWELQRELLPKIPATISGVSVGTVYRAADSRQEVGGDWYDVFSPRPGCVALVVGDIVGHDLPAAAAIGRTYTAVRLLAEQEIGTPGQLLERLDEACAVVPEAAYSTVGYAEFFPQRMQLRYACAGHPPPLLVDAAGARFLWEGRSTPVAVPSKSRATGEVHLSGPARLVWFSDGLIERPGTAVEDSLEELRVAVGSLDPRDSPERWCERILEAMVHDTVVADDIVILCATLASGKSKKRPQEFTPPPTQVRSLEDS